MSRFYTSFAVTLDGPRRRFRRVSTGLVPSSSSGRRRVDPQVRVGRRGPRPVLPHPALRQPEEALRGALSVSSSSFSAIPAQRPVQRVVHGPLARIAKGEAVDLLPLFRRPLLVAVGVENRVGEPPGAPNDGHGPVLEPDELGQA